MGGSKRKSSRAVAWSRARHPGPVRQLRRDRVEHPLQHPACAGFVVEVVRHLAAVAAALAALDLPAGLGADQEDIAPVRTVPAVEVVLDAPGHISKLEHMYERGKIGIYGEWPA